MMAVQDMVGTDRPSGDLLAWAAGRPSSVREDARDATRDAHERMHRHPAFAALADGTIAPADYRALLARLLGFHAAVERATGSGGWRAAALRRDLAALGASPAAIAALPSCDRLPDLSSPERRAGARYVVEGSALGGRVLARAMRAGPAGAALRFLEGGGPPGAWRDCLNEMERLGHDPGARRRVVEGARETFAAFEAWLAGWRVDHD